MPVIRSSLCFQSRRRGDPLWSPSAWFMRVKSPTGLQPDRRLVARAARRVVAAARVGERAVGAEARARLLAPPAAGRVRVLDVALDGEREEGRRRLEPDAPAAQRR